VTPLPYDYGPARQHRTNANPLRTVSVSDAEVARLREEADTLRHQNEALKSGDVDETGTVVGDDGVLQMLEEGWTAR
jgi:hypothetical protein